MKNIHVLGLAASSTCESDHYFSAELLLFSSSNCSMTMGGGLNSEICTKKNHQLDVKSTKTQISSESNSSCWIILDNLSKRPRLCNQVVVMIVVKVR